MSASLPTAVARSFLARHAGSGAVLDADSYKISLADDGVYRLTFWSVDQAGTVGVHGSAEVKID